MKSFVVIDKQTSEVMMCAFGDQFVLPASWDIRFFNHDIEPIMKEVNGKMYLVQNAIVLHPTPEN